MGAFGGLVRKTGSPAERVVSAKCERRYKKGSHTIESKCFVGDNTGLPVRKSPFGDPVESESDIYIAWKFWCLIEKHVVIPNTSMGEVGYNVGGYQ